MRITKLHLENFRIHQDSTLEFGDSPFVLIRGKNFAGKSTIGQALSMCLTPSTTGLDPRGTGFISKIKRGQTKAVIEADIQTKLHLIRRTVTLSTGPSGRTQKSASLTSPDWNPAAFDKKLDGSRAALTVILNTDAFLRMDEEKQKNLLAGLALPARYDFDHQIVQSVERVLGMLINFEGEPFAVINLAYKKLFEERQLINRQVKEFVVPEALPVPAGVDSRSMQDRLTGLRMLRRERQDNRDAAVGEAAKVEAERERIRAKKLSLLSDEKLAALRKVANGKGELNRLAKEKKQVEAAIDERLRELGRLEEIPDAGTKCPTCDQIIDADRLKALVSGIAAALREVKDQNFSIHQKMKALGDVDEAVRLIATHEATVKELADAEMPELVLFDFRPYDQSLAQIDTEIGELTGQLRPVIAAEEREKEIMVRREQLLKLKNKAALLDTLVKYFDKDGIKAKLIGEYIGGFEHRLNEVISAWGYSATLSIEPYSFDVTNARGDVIPVRELSGAERILFSLAFQVAVSRTANIGLVVIDEVAMLLPELRPVLHRRLHEMIEQGYLEQAILLEADSLEEMTSLPGASIFTVEEGAVHGLRDELVAG